MIKQGFLAGIVLGLSTNPAAAEPVLLVSIDGLRPGDVLEAEQRGLVLPNLRRMVSDGAHATGVVGNLPTLTYPSHTTLITGVAPARHGIVSNTTFDPLQINAGGWYWYAQDIKARTLWDVARSAGLTTANVHWPVSVGVRSVTWNLPQIWRTGHADDRKLVRALATPGLLDLLEHDCGNYADGIDESLKGDQNRARFAVQLIRRHQPGFMTVYLTALDHEQHHSGPGSQAAHATLQAIDALVGDLVAAEREAHADAAIAVVSDHGFSTTDTEVNLFRPFIDAGLISLGKDGKVTDWQAMPWPSGGSIAVVLAQPEDQALTDRVSTLLSGLAKDPSTRISKIIGREDIKRAGANPAASFYVNLAKGALAAGFAGPNAPLRAPAHYKGMHGYFPEDPEMRSTFLIAGPGIKPGTNLGEIDMRTIAPTLAGLLGGTLPEAELAGVDLKR